MAKAFLLDTDFSENSVLNIWKLDFQTHYGIFKNY